MSPRWVFAHGISADLLHRKEHIFSLRNVTQSFTTTINELIFTWLRWAFISVSTGGKYSTYVKKCRGETNNGAGVAR